MPPEPDGTLAVSTVLTVLCLLLAALYAAGESAVGCLSPSQVKKDAESGDKKSQTLLKVLQAQNGAVTPLQLGLFFCGLLGLSLCISGFWPSAQEGLQPLKLAPVLSCLLVSLCYMLVFFLFADLLPKKGARHGAESFCKRWAGLIWWLSCLARPLLLLSTWIANGLLRLFHIDPHALEDAMTEEEILQMVGKGEERGVIAETEKDMIANILDFNDTTAGETMTHRTDIIAVEDTAPIRELVEAAVEHGCSRLPVYHEDIDSVVGICYAKDLLPYVGADIPQGLSLTDFMRPAYFIPETKKCSSLFTEMTERKVQIAIVVDEYGGTAGLITLEDLMESIVGNIQDEYDNEEDEFFRLSERAFTVDGSAAIDEVSDLAGVDLPEGDYDTIAGLVTELLGRIPKEGERPQVQVAGLTVTVLKIEDQRLSRLLLVKDLPVPQEK